MEAPYQRPRRLRRSPAIRRMVAETKLSVDDLVAPLFVAEALEAPAPIAAMPGQVQHSLASLVEESDRIVGLGIPAVVLFGLPAEKDAHGSGASDPSGIVQRAIAELKGRHGDALVVIPDLCLDEYTDHGHCGILTSGGVVDNDATIERYGEVAIAQARAGADLVAPSGMMDGQVAAIRGALDDEGFGEVGILAYAAKYASALYGPFREAVDVEIAGGGDRRAYQQDPANAREAIREVLLDVEEGADIVMVKPAMSYLDVVAEVASLVDVPVAAYHVSGEYAMVMAAGERGWIDAPAVAMEQLLAMKRAGASMLLTYFATMAAEAMA